MPFLRARRTALALAVLVSCAGYASAQEQPPAAAARPVVANPLAQFDASLSGPWIADADFVWGASLAAFDLPDYLNRNAPHLNAQAEFIAHWCGYYSISPKVLLTILEMQSALVSTPPSAAVLANPLAGLVPGDAFEPQVLSALATLFQDFHAYRNAIAGSPAAASTNAATYALLNLLRGQASPLAFGLSIEPSRTRFLEVLTRMFPEPLASIKSSDAIAAVPPTDLLQFPWKHGVSWYFGGVHTTTGANDGSPMSSLDSFLGGEVWGSNTSTSYVVAAHAGTVTRFSSCNVRVTAPSGWQTNYYHLDGVIVSTGQQVAANQTLGVYANNQAQALCDGGSSTGPHVHYSLLNNGVYNSLDGVTWNGYVIHPGRFSYDTDQNYMWLIKDGVKYYANAVRMLSTSTNLPGMTINDVSISEGNSGTKLATFTVSLSSPATGTTTAFYETADVTAASFTPVANTSPVTIPSSGTASPYPSTITVPAGLGTLTRLTVQLKNFSHSYPSDLQVLLVGPGGQYSVLMSRHGGSTPANNLTLTFDDGATNMMGTAALTTGSYRVPNSHTGVFPSPAPVIPQPSNSSLSTFTAMDPAGTWKLFVLDEAAGDTGALSGGWQLNITSTGGSLDYIRTTGVVSIAAGASSGSITVAIVGDTNVEPSETFNVNLSGASNANLTDATGVGTITNDDYLPFTDPTLTAASSVLKAIHITELRTRINAIRAARGLSAFSWTTPTLTAGATMALAVHVTELRTALNQAYTAAGRTLPTYTDPTVSGFIKAVHITELRAAVLGIE